jgi:hypothetical protein
MWRFGESINLQLLAMSTSGVRRQMEKVEAGAPQQARAAPVESQLYQKRRTGHA